METTFCTDAGADPHKNLDVVNLNIFLSAEDIEVKSRFSIFPLSLSLVHKITID